ncbi:hypothetical protein [Mycobacteroides saopaulense]|uniref:DUF4352 domain-containing protein n=1 Tax=Mycobacteroides saopaulense TaxID=1578165 RepID=A0ABX3C4H2_9MYCO|nr:hypothetical protein [Mycobacteroides saopaulense]OHT88607.1 hypothetical protein BKG68_01490 [Mycobacteroides saopaulense]OHU13426.1 hypothetical protein BKG73_01495 [Mycobacteroides saopaulense]
MKKLHDWLTPKRFWWGLLIIVLSISGVFGGLRTATSEDSYTELKAGQTYNAGPFDVTIQNARVGYGAKLAIQPPPGPGYALLVVEATIKNTSSQTLAPPKAFYTSSPELVQLGSPPDQFVNPKYIRRLDYMPANAVNIQPGMTDRIVFVWTAARSSLTIGKPIVLQVNGFDFRYVADWEEHWLWEPIGRHGVYHLTLEDSA